MDEDMREETILIQNTQEVYSREHRGEFTAFVPVFMSRLQLSADIDGGRIQPERRSPIGFCDPTMQRIRYGLFHQVPRSLGQIHEVELAVTDRLQRFEFTLNHHLPSARLTDIRATTPQPRLGLYLSLTTCMANALSQRERSAKTGRLSNPVWGK